MSAFRDLLRKERLSPKGRRWLFVPYDQLTDKVGPLAREPARELGVVLVENPWKAGRRPYHKQKLALVLASLRHFALEQQRRGVAVRHVVVDGPYREALEPLVAELGPLRVMEPAERELRVDLEPLVRSGGIEVIPHDGWLTLPEGFRESQPQGPPWRMDSFYRFARRQTGVLVVGGRFAGGKLTFDTQNRKAWQGNPPAPQPPRFPRDPVKDEVGDLVEQRFGQHPGRLDPDGTPATVSDAERLWSWAKRECLPAFGPFEDAMSASSSTLFHTRISGLLNLHRLLPARVVEDALGLDIPLASKEGFVRQILGWREFVRHVHRETDGFRDLPGGSPERRARPGDGGFGRWAGTPWEGSRGPDEGDGDAAPSSLEADRLLPPSYWGEASGLRCLDHVVAGVWAEGYGHHITRLMVLANLATLLDVSPRELTDWFWVAYTDAYDWVVEPNVLGMGTFAAGDVMVTKPYVSGAAYINRMSDFCADCAFDPRRDCPITNLYWAFLDRHRQRLSGNPRLRLALASAGKRGPALRRRDQAVFRWARERLEAGEILHPRDVPP